MITRWPPPSHERHAHHVDVVHHARGLNWLDTALSAGLALWRTRSAIHDPGTVLLHLAIGLASGGDCPAALGALRAAQGAAQARVMGLTRTDGEDSEVVVDVTLITSSISQMASHSSLTQPGRSGSASRFLMISRSW